MSAGLLVAVTAGLSACGQKGSLFYPQTPAPTGRATLLQSLSPLDPVVPAATAAAPAASAPVPSTPSEPGATPPLPLPGQ